MRIVATSSKVAGLWTGLVVARLVGSWRMAHPGTPTTVDLINPAILVLEAGPLGVTHRARAVAEPCPVTDLANAPDPAIAGTPCT